MSTDAKQSWLKIVKRHKKKQSGLPALSTLNPDAGNVEHNVAMFNMMQPNGSVTVDAANGGIGEGVAESYNPHADSLSGMGTVVIHYDALPVEIVTDSGSFGGYYDSDFGNYLPDDPTTKELTIEWDYEVDVQDVVEYLQDLAEVQQLLDPKQILSDDEYNQRLIQNLEDLMIQFEEELRDEFLERATEDAEEHYDYEDYAEYYNESMSKAITFEDLDDGFDMSTRTLL